MTFYLDENLGSTFAKTLIDAGLTVEFHKNYFSPGTPDTIWIPDISQRGWIGVTLDINTRFNPLEIEAIVTSKARILQLRVGKNGTHPILAKNFVQTMPKIIDFLKNNPAPCLATITRPSIIFDYRRENLATSILNNND